MLSARTSSANDGSPGARFAAALPLATGLVSVSQYCLASAGIRQRHVLQGFDSPCITLARQHGKDERIDSVGAAWMRYSSGEAAPEVHDCGFVGDRDDIDQFVLERRVAVDRFVDGGVQSDDLFDP